MAFSPLFSDFNDYSDEDYFSNRSSSRKTKGFTPLFSNFEDYLDEDEKIQRQLEELQAQAEIERNKAGQTEEEGFRYRDYLTSLDPVKDFFLPGRGGLKGPSGEPINLPGGTFGSGVAEQASQATRRAVSQRGEAGLDFEEPRQFLSDILAGEPVRESAGRALRGELEDVEKLGTFSEQAAEESLGRTWEQIGKGLDYIPGVDTEQNRFLQGAAEQTEATTPAGRAGETFGKGLYETGKLGMALAGGLGAGAAVRGATSGANIASKAAPFIAEEAAASGIYTGLSDDENFARDFGIGLGIGGIGYGARSVARVMGGIRGGREAVEAALARDAAQQAEDIIENTAKLPAAGETTRAVQINDELNNVEAILDSVRRGEGLSEATSTGRATEGAEVATGGRRTATGAVDQRYSDVGIMKGEGWARKTEAEKVRDLVKYRNKLRREVAAVGEAVDDASQAKRVADEGITMDAVNAVDEGVEGFGGMEAVRATARSIDQYYNSANKDYEPLVSTFAGSPEPVFEKAGLGDLYGIVRKHFDDMNRANRGYRKQIGGWMERTGRDAQTSQKIWRALDGQDVKLSSTEQEVVNEAREWLDDFADKLGLEPDQRITDYIPHLFPGKGKSEIIPPELAKIYFENPGSIKSRFLKRRTNKDGYLEDAWQALDAYASAASKQIHMNPAIDSLKKARPKVSEGMAEYINSQIQNIKGQGAYDEKLVRTLDRMFGKIPGVSGEGATGAGSRGLRNLIYRATLGANPMSALRNLTQANNTFAELGSKWTGKGYFDSIRTILGRGDSARMEELIDTGVLDDMYIDTLRGEGSLARSGGRRFIQKVDDALWWMFDTAEQINRSSAYFGAKSRALAKGASESEARKAGAKLARKTQFKFSEIDTPHMYQGDLTKNLTQFMSFNTKQLEYLKDLGVDVVKKSDGSWTFSPKGAAKVARWIGANVAMAATLGEVLGIDMGVEDFVPFWDDIQEGELPKSPMTQLVMGDRSSVGLKDIAFGTDPYSGEEAPRGELASEFLSEEAPGLFLPGGSQYQKTMGGLEAVEQGGSMTDSGNLRFLVDDTGANRRQGAVFGEWNLPGASEYFESEQSPLSERQTQQVMNAETPEQKQQYFDFYSTMQGEGTHRNQAYTEIKDEIAQGNLNRAQRLAEEYNASLVERAGDFLDSYSIDQVPEDLIEELLGYRIELDSAAVRRIVRNMSE